VTFEEGTWAAWLYDLLKPHVTELIVSDQRKNALLKEGTKSDKIDARKLADLLRGGYLRSVYYGENGLRTLKELARSYLTISQDLTRVMNRVKVLYRSWGITCGRRSNGLQGGIRRNGFCGSGGSYASNCPARMGSAKFSRPTRHAKGSGCRGPKESYLRPAAFECDEASEHQHPEELVPFARAH
jgi:hypothetical protein